MLADEPSIDLPFIVVPVECILLVKQLFESGALVARAFRALVGSRFTFTEQSVKVLIIVHALLTATPFPLFVIFAGVQTLPHELDKASVIDGATRLRHVWHIMIRSTLR